MTARAPVVIGAAGLTQQLQSGDQLKNIFTVAAKPADTSRNTTTTPAADPNMTAFLGTGTWLVRMVCFYDNTPGSAAGFKYGVSFSGTATWGQYRVKSFAPSATGSTPSASGELQGVGTGTPPNTSIVAGSSAPGYVEIEATIIVSSSGNVAFTWSQNSSTGTNVTVKAGSYLEYLQVA